MLKETVVMFAFMLALAGIISCVFLIQKASERQGTEARCVLELANEIG